MSDFKFYSLQGLLNEIYAGDTCMSMEEFEKRIQEAYDDGELSGTQYDWLMANIE